MMRKQHILHFVFSLLLTVSVAALAHAQGNVTVHSDPRLSVLIKKPHNVDPPPAPVVHRKPAAKPVNTTGASVAGSASTKAMIVSSAAPAAVTVAEKPLPMENGHVAGWTPPVHRKARAIYSGKGFRVQIYNGPDRQKAIQVKTEFMRSFPGIRTYLTYVSPSFRVKVGDYRNRSDAVGMWKEANSIYNPSMIVPDLVTISTF